MTGGNQTILYAYWASSCSWRVRAALHLKRIAHEERAVDIVGERRQLTESYRAINPSQKVPALVIDGETLVESMAILQYLEETRPKPSLTYNTPLLRARVREICEAIVSGIQPLQNTGLKSIFDTEDQYIRFTKHWCERGLRTLEALLQRTAGQFCVGNQLTIADLCFVPQVYNFVERHKLSLSAYPTVSKLYESLQKEQVFAETHPKNFKPKQ